MSTAPAAYHVDNKHRVRLTGTLDFDSVLRVREPVENWIRQGPEQLEIDFSGVEASGSAGVSLMMCWLRAACQADKQIRFVSIPDLLLRIIEVSGLTRYLNTDHPCTTPHT